MPTESQHEPTYAEAVKHARNALETALLLAATDDERLPVLYALTALAEYTPAEPKETTRIPVRVAE